MNEIELAAKAEQIAGLGLGRFGRAYFLFPPGETTARERELLEAELGRRGIDIAIAEGTIEYMR